MWRTYAGSRRDFPDAVDIRLEENFRSTGHILAAANAIIAEDKARLGKTLFTRKGQGARVEFMSFRDGEAEAGGLAEALLTRKRDRPRQRGRQLKGRTPRDARPERRPQIASALKSPAGVQLLAFHRGGCKRKI